jgi:SAM-dependent methyltransferase
VRAESKGEVALETENTVVVSANEDVLKWFRNAGYPSRNAAYEGVTSIDMHAVIRTGGDWRKLATKATQEVFDKYEIVNRIRKLFEGVPHSEGELSVGRNFKIYIAGMEAGMKLKLEDMFPWVVPGLLVDMGCGSGKMMVHLSERFPTSQIVGVDMSTQLLKVADSQHYPNQNATVVRGNIIEARFAALSVTTFLYSSVVHEIRSYTGYNTNNVRAGLRNAHHALKVGGRIIIRDGVKPENRTVWMRVDAETEERFRRFAKDFKKTAPNPGVRFVEREHGGHKWFVLSLHDANEFLSKKDYTENWDIEVNEEFGTFTTAEWKEELEAIGYKVLECRSYLNEWIEKNRYENRVWLHAESGNAPGEKLPFPNSTIVVVAEKRPVIERALTMVTRFFRSPKTCLKSWFAPKAIIETSV